MISHSTAFDSIARRHASSRLTAVPVLSFFALVGVAFRSDLNRSTTKGVISATRRSPKVSRTSLM